MSAVGGISPVAGRARLGLPPRDGRDLRGGGRGPAPPSLLRAAVMKSADQLHPGRARPSTPGRSNHRVKP